MLIKLTRAQAKREFNKGNTVILNPSKCALQRRPNFSDYGGVGVWQAFKKQDIAYGEVVVDFDTIVKKYKEVCDFATGKIIHFYIPATGAQLERFKNDFYAVFDGNL